jgi:HJR/Mrr/RecB family endonuclease
MTSFVEVFQGVFQLFSIFWWIVLLIPFQGPLRKRKSKLSDWKKATLISFLFWIGMAFVQVTAHQSNPISSWFWTAGGILFILLTIISVKDVLTLFNRNETSRSDLQWMLSLNPTEFERLVADTYRSYGNKVQIIGGKGDHGIDLIVEAPNGEKRVVQCKRWKGKIGEPVVRDFAGAMQHEGASEGAIITTGTYTPQAIAWAKGKPIRLYDGEAFSKIVEQSQKGQKQDPSNALKSPKSQSTDVRFCPQCGAPLVLRTAKKGDYAGNQFYGCSRYPNCRVILALEDI